jgi:hypothetical protein
MTASIALREGGLRMQSRTISEQPNGKDVAAHSNQDQVDLPMPESVIESTIPKKS